MVEKKQSVNYLLFMMAKDSNCWKLLCTTEGSNNNVPLAIFFIYSNNYQQLPVIILFKLLLGGISN